MLLLLSIFSLKVVNDLVVWQQERCTKGQQTLVFVSLLMLSNDLEPNSSDLNRFLEEKYS